MANINALMTSTHDEWETPKEFFIELNKEFNFKLDPCCTKKNRKCDIYFTKEQNGLNQDWSKYGSVFVNPPYGREIGKWVEKSYNEWIKGGGGCTVVLLIPARTDTRYFHNFIYGKAELRFIKGRLKFIGYAHKLKRVVNNQPATFPSMVVIFDKNWDKGTIL